MTEEKIVFSEPIKQYVKSITETDDEIIIPVIGVPFGSPFPDGKDLHKEFFSQATDVGNLKEAMVYFNHNQFYPSNDSPDELEKAAMLARAFKGQILGIARKAETTEDGIIYNIVLDKRKPYSRVIRQMVEDNLLDVSSGAKYRELDADNTGLISKWHLVEVSFTPTPANPNAVALTKSILVKALEETTMPEEKENPEVVAGVDESLIPDDVKSAFANLEPKVEAPPTVTVEQFNELKSQNEALANELAEIKSLIKSVQATLPYMVKQFGEIFQRETTKSTFEAQVSTNALAPNSPRPAPTPNKKPIFGDKGPVVMKAPGV